MHPHLDTDNGIDEQAFLVFFFSSNIAALTTGLLLFIYHTVNPSIFTSENEEI